MAGPYLDEQQLARVTEALSLEWVLAGPRLPGKVWEEILAAAKGTEVNRIRGNRPVVDLKDGTSVKTVEAKGCDLGRMRGGAWDFIMSRIPVASSLAEGERVDDVDPDRFGVVCLRAYNELARVNEWQRLSFLLRGSPVGDRRQFLYWESPVAFYEPDRYWWKDTGKAAAGDRNFAGYPISASRQVIRGVRRPSAFRWTSGGKQFYVRHAIPADAQLIEVRRLMSRSQAIELILAGARQMGRSVGVDRLQDRPGALT